MTGNYRQRLCTLFVLLVMSAACTGGAATDSTENRLTQWGAANPTYLNATIAAADVLDFDGTGLAGLPTGEVILIDGKALVTDSSGTVSVLDGDDSIVIAGVTTNFVATSTETTTESITCDGLNDYLNDIVGDDEEDRIATIVIRGTLTSVDYVVEAGVSQDPDLISGSDLDVTIVGIKNPYYFGDDSWTIDEDTTVGIGEYPLHLHFITEDESILGHVRDCTLASGAQIEIGLVNTFDLRMDYSDN